MSEAPREPNAVQAQIQAWLADANRLRAKGNLEEALKRCGQALAAAPGNWEAHELAGDLLYQQRRGADAIQHYRLARAGNPARQLLEDKVARASLIVAEAQIMRLRAQDLLAGAANQAPRRPAISALLSALLPGFGQIYNHEVVKGAAVLCVVLLLVMAMAAAAFSSLRGAGGATVAGRSVLEVLLSRPTLGWTLTYIVLWCYAVADAALMAARMMTAPKDMA